ncbi:hypothetical protein [Nocardia carnea]|uniref:hypothetical protein n=1 Tax=Nocardia carnea TaxID=37328 RepID=UPI002458FAC2|nr:hypothetical protein [Nocardia carnea]
MVLLPDNGRAGIPAGEWITHLWSGGTGPALLGPGTPGDLVALITDEPAAVDAVRAGVGCTLDLSTLLA